MENKKKDPPPTGGNPAHVRKRKEMAQKIPDREIYPGKTVRELEAESRSIVDLIYIEDFAKGVSTAYKDERCAHPRQFIRAHPDGSEDLILYNLVSEEEIVLQRLAEPGKGKRSYLLQDPRYLTYVQQLQENDGK